LLTVVGMLCQRSGSELKSRTSWGAMSLLSVALMILVPATALTLHSSAAELAFRSVSLGDNTLDSAATASSMSSSWSYPQKALSEVQNASALAAEILSHLGLSPGVTDATADRSPDSSGLVWRKPPAWEYFDGFLEGYQVVSFVNDQRAHVDLYYSSSGTTGGLLLAVDATLDSDGPGPRAELPYSSAALSIGGSLGLPLVTASQVSYIYSSGTSSVVFSSVLEGLDLVGFNLAAFSFDNGTGKLLRVQVRPFLASLSTDIALLPESVDEQAAGAVRTQMVGEADTIFDEGVVGIRYRVPTPGTGGLPANTSVPADAHVAFAYEYRADLRNSSDGGLNYSVLVLVDCVTGDVLLSFRSPIPMPSGHEYVVFGWIGVSVAVVALFFVALMFLSPDVAWLVMGSYLILAYVRLRGANILDNFNRGRIMGYVSARPGSSFTDIRDSLHIANGNLAYHLSILEKLELVSSVKQGRSRRFFPIGVAHPTDDNHFLGKTESKILEQLGEKGPLSNSAIAIFLGMSRQRTHYNLRLLEKRGLVDQLGHLWKARLTEQNTPTGR